MSVQLPSSFADGSLPIDPLIKPRVDFWVKIYSEYTTSQGVLHDGKNPLRIYEVIDWTDNPKLKNQKISAAKLKWRSVLSSLRNKKGNFSELTTEEEQVLKLFSDSSDSARFAQALDRKRLRLQIGQKNRFMQGYKESGKWLPFMEEIFKSQGLPVELTRLPFVESSFNTQARSKVGASGIWQFMQSTGRLFLKIDDQVDERNDPILATYAAAQLLKLNYESLGKWPLAVTAYNHGRTGILRAVKKVGSDNLAELIQDYRSRTFGFASSNFYSSLIAAIIVEKDAEKYFGKIVRFDPESVYNVTLPYRIKLKDLCQFLSLSKKDIIELNPALQSSVIRSAAKIPKGLILRLPLPKDRSAEEAQRLFISGVEEIPKRFKL